MTFLKDFFKSVKAKILVGLLSFLLGFMIMAVYSGGTASLFTQIISFVTVPVQKVSANVSTSAAEFFGKFLNADKITAENEILREQVAELQKKLIDYEKTKHENDKLREIIEVTESRRDLEITTASVIARDSLGNFQSFTVDKGSLDGIKYLDPVITEHGLVGYVSEIALTSAKVTTILDISIDVGAYDVSTRDIGIVCGTIELAAQGYCQMEHLPRGSEVSKNDLILTSGGGIFPKDILIGTVIDVVPSQHQTGLIAVIEPAAKIGEIKDVIIVTNFEGQSEN